MLVWKRGAGPRNWMSLAHGMGNVVFHAFVGTVMFELTCGRGQNSKLVMYFLPRFLSLMRNVWEPQLKMAEYKISI